MKLIFCEGEALHRQLQEDIHQTFAQAAWQGFEPLEDAFNELAKRCDRLQPRGRLRLLETDSAADKA
ncbi:MAG: hypothetical protein KZQ58_11655 [gamma proteobacterium symbiont of Bathyaustriella thionipta]|nr:hypothetical protein [gamma proteobacterium symbiont of Bathyaustriella thionipta]